MKHLLLLLAACACSLQVAAQNTPKSADPPVRMPGAGSGNSGSMPTPSDRGAIVVPPSTGNEEIVKMPNKAIDPKIDDATGDIDQKNRKKSEQKGKKQGRD